MSGPQTSTEVGQTDDGSVATEYALVSALVAAVVIVSARAIGVSVAAAFLTLLARL